jgi:uncharacterized coiled-coil protein SlyX
LAGKPDIQYALKRLDTLTHEEARMAAAQILKASRAVDDRVRGVHNRVVAIDDRVAAVDDHVAEVNDMVAAVDDHVAEVNDRVANVDDKVTEVVDRA